MMNLHEFIKKAGSSDLEESVTELSALMPVMVSQEVVPLEAARGRFLARSIVAPISVPSSDLALREGYAVFLDGLNPYLETRLPISANIPAGMHFFLPKLFQGSAAHVFEGSPIPKGANSVFIKEDVGHEDDFVTLPYGQEVGRNIRRAGGDFSLGEPVLTSGIKICPHHLSACAALGLSHLPVFSPLRVAVFSVGENLLDARHDKGSPLVGAKFDANRVMLVSLLNARGITALDLGILPNDWGRILPALELAATGCNVILCSGGVSRRDNNGVETEPIAGGNIDFLNLAMKPNAPIALGMIGQCPFFGIPDSAFAGFVAFTRFIAPLLDKLAGREGKAKSGFFVPAAFSYAKVQGRRDYLPVMLQSKRDGSMELRLSPKSGEEAHAALSSSDGLAEIPEQVMQVLAGQNVHFLPISMLSHGD